MEKNKVLENLCYYNIRNPNNILQMSDEIGHVKPQLDCYCNNCFYGRTKLAEYILELLDKKETTYIKIV